MACKANCNCYLTNLVGIDPKCNRFDMTDLYRVTITDDMTPEAKALFQSYNDNCEAVEDLWIELDFQKWEQMEKAAKKLQNRNAKQRDRDNRDHVKSLHKQGFSLAEKFMTLSMQSASQATCSMIAPMKSWPTLAKSLIFNRTFFVLDIYPQPVILLP